MPSLYLGLAMWGNPDWRGGFYAPHSGREHWLEDYSGVFPAVEGNTTFYSGAPRPETVAGWATQVPEHFRFCFKLPQQLTHVQRLQDIEAGLDDFLTALAPLRGRLGPMMIQLPRDFGHAELPALRRVLERWPSEIPCAVEVRHSEFFHKGEAEREFNRLLITYGVNRVMLDVRPLFSTGPGKAPGLLKAQAEKPKLPLHVISTGDFPLVRFIGHLDKSVNERYFADWRERLSLWIKQGKTPFLFVHTADNRGAPELARQLYDPLVESAGLAELGTFAGERQNRLL